MAYQPTTPTTPTWICDRVAWSPVLLRAHSRTFDLLTASIAGIQAAVASRGAQLRTAGPPVSEAHRRLRQAGTAPQRGPRDQSHARSRSRARSMRSAGRRAFGVRCTAFRSRSRTTSTSATCRPQVAIWCSREPTLLTTPRSFERLRQAGAIIFLKTNLDSCARLAGLEFAGRSNPQPVRSETQPGRVERRHRGGGECGIRHLGLAPRPGSRFGVRRAITLWSVSRRRGGS